jgi:hypothetical protein
MKSHILLLLIICVHPVLCQEEDVYLGPLADSVHELAFQNNDVIRERVGDDYGRLFECISIEAQTVYYPEYSDIEKLLMGSAGFLILKANKFTVKELDDSRVHTGKVAEADDATGAKYILFNNPVILYVAESPDGEDMQSVRKLNYVVRRVDASTYIVARKTNDDITELIAKIDTYVIDDIIKQLNPDELEIIHSKHVNNESSVRNADSYILDKHPDIVTAMSKARVQHYLIQFAYKNGMPYKLVTTTYFDEDDAAEACERQLAHLDNPPLLDTAKIRDKDLARTVEYSNSINRELLANTKVRRDGDKLLIEMTYPDELIDKIIKRNEMSKELVKKHEQRNK